MTVEKPTPRRQLYPTEGRVQPAVRHKRPFTDADIDVFQEICSQKTDPAEYPLAADVQHNAVIYDGAALRAAARGSTEERDALMAELHKCLLHGPGVFAIRDAVPVDVVERASLAFQKIIAEEKTRTGARGDHFAPAGKNERIWNAFQKHAAADPAGFVEYYANDVLGLVCESWLGPGYQVTAQVNVIKPGGRAQEPHRDYHLGFQDETTAARFPLASQVASQLLTLQGAVAHTDMPLASGPTQLLPFSQHFDYGYQAYRHAEFVDVFRRNMVQLPLHKGDALFFNPALFHAAGDNDTTDMYRSANLLQVSACWGRAMESVDRLKIVRDTWTHVQAFTNGGKDGKSKPLPTEVDALTAAICEGYSFPTNLDTDPPPPSGHCPPTQLDLARELLAQGVDQEMASGKLEAQAARRQA